MDMVRGDVLRVVDGDTFDMELTEVAEDNEYEYDDEERVRIANINAPELNTVAGQAAKKLLQRRIGGKEVEVEVHARDDFGRFVGKVSVLV